jgi:hypothetical protein
MVVSNGQMTGLPDAVRTTFVSGLARTRMVYSESAAKPRGFASPSGKLLGSKYTTLPSTWKVPMASTKRFWLAGTPTRIVRAFTVFGSTSSLKTKRRMLFR